MQDRIDTLKRISGLEVQYYRSCNEHCFAFGPPEAVLKSVHTYRKARVFAEGVATGRELER